MDVTSITVGCSIVESLLNNLPLERNALSLMALTPGVSEAPDGAWVSIQGSRACTNDFQLDGVDNSPATGSLPVPASRVYGSLGSGVNFDAVAEIQVKTGGLEASETGASAGVVNVITKSGGNEYHGSVSFYGRPAGFQAAAGKVSALRLSPVTESRARATVDAAAELGGYILRDRLFFYLNAAPRRDVRSGWVPPGFGQALDGRNPFPRTDTTVFLVGKLDWALSPSDNLSLSSSAEASRTGAVTVPAWGGFPGAVTAGAFVRRAWMVDPATGTPRRLGGEGLPGAEDALYIQTGGFFTRPDVGAVGTFHAFYVQDQWKLSPNFTLQLGIRWDLQRLGADAGSVSLPLDWSPQAGLIWDLRGDGRTVVKAHWGRYAEKTSLETARGALGGEGFVTGVLWGDAALTDFRNDDLGVPVCAFGGLDGVVAPGTRAGCQDEIVVSFQRELPRQLAVGVTFWTAWSRWGPGASWGGGPGNSPPTCTPTGSGNWR